MITPLYTITVIFLGSCYIPALCNIEKYFLADDINHLYGPEISCKISELMKYLSYYTLHSTLTSTYSYVNSYHVN